MTSQRHLCHHISIYDVCAFVLSLNIFVCAYFKEGEFHADREIMRVVTLQVPPNLPEETGLKCRCEGRKGVMMK